MRLWGLTLLAIYLTVPLTPKVSTESRAAVRPCKVASTGKNLSVDMS